MLDRIFASMINQSIKLTEMLMICVKNNFAEEEKYGSFMS